MATVIASPARKSISDKLSTRIRDRVLARRGPMTPPFELEYRHIFVLPTKFGWGFGFMLVFMALGGLNFNNNMALMLVFLLGTIAQITTLIAYRNLSGLKIDRVYPEPVFSGEDAHFRVFVSNGDFLASTVTKRLGVAEEGLVRAGCACYTTLDEVERLVTGVGTMP